MNQKECQNCSSIAWFKLAHLIEKKEKEKALNVFRLLTYSLRDKAYSLQLEGDILQSLNDTEQAQERYKNAAFLYQKDKRWIHAVSLYENLLANNCKNYINLTSIILCYGQLGWENKFQEKLTQIYELAMQNSADEHGLTSAIKLLTDMAKELENESFKTQIYSKIQALLSSIPKTTAEKIEYMFKKV